MGWNHSSKTPCVASTRLLGLLCVSIGLSGCSRQSAALTRDDGVWAGTFVAESTAATGPTLELETWGDSRGPWTHFVASFDLRGLPSGPGAADCTVEGASSAVANELACAPRTEADRCPRRIRLVRQGDGFEVRLTGAGWADACAPMSGEAVPSVVKLHRAHPADVMVDRYIWNARQSDLGSSGGRMVSVVLGSNPQAVVRSMAKSILRKLPEGQLPTASHLSDLVAALHTGLIVKCGGLPFPEVEWRWDNPPMSGATPIPSRCTLDDAESVARSVVAADLERRSHFEDDPAAGKR